MVFEFTLSSSIHVSLQPNLFSKWICHEWNYSTERNNSAGPIINFSYSHSLIILLCLPKESSENDTKLSVFAPLTCEWIHVLFPTAFLRGEDERWVEIEKPILYIGHTSRWPQLSDTIGTLWLSTHVYRCTCEKGQYSPLYRYLF